MTSNERIRTSWAINHYPQIYKSGTFLRGKQIMPYVERATSPKKQRLFQAFKYQTDGGAFQGNIHRGKNAEEYKVRGAQQEHRKG